MSENWILVLTRGNLSLTMNAVKSFLAQDIGRMRVLLLDNGGVDRTVAWARTQPGVSAFIQHPAKSVSASWNHGLKMIWDAGAEHALVCNNDVVLRPETYSTLVKMSVEFVTAIGDADRHRALGPELRKPLVYSLRPHPDFSCFLMRKGVWDKVGPFDERYLGAFGEDCDYHVRMHRRGVEAKCINLGFWHVGAGSQTIKNADGAARARISEQANKNRELFKHEYGCLPGTPEYEKLFDEASFGIERDRD